MAPMITSRCSSKALKVPQDPYEHMHPPILGTERLVKHIMHPYHGIDVGNIQSRRHIQESHHSYALIPQETNFRQYDRDDIRIDAINTILATLVVCMNWHTLHQYDLPCPRQLPCAVLRWTGTVPVLSNAGSYSFISDMQKASSSRIVK